MLRRVSTDSTQGTSSFHLSGLMAILKQQYEAANGDAAAAPPVPHHTPPEVAAAYHLHHHNNGHANGDHNRSVHAIPTDPITSHFPNLIDGTPLNHEQLKVYTHLRDMIVATFKSKTPESHSKDEKVLHGAEIAADFKHFFTPECIRRYLISRGWCEKKAYDMLMTTLNWRHHHVPDSYVHDEYVACLKSRFMEWGRHDAHGRPTLYIKSANADLSISRDNRVKFMVTTLEKGTSLMEPQYSNRRGVEQWNIVIDESNRDSHHTDNKFLSHVTPMLTSHYAQRLHRCYVVNPGFLTKLVYGIIKYFLDEGTTKKIKMVHAKTCKTDKNVRIVHELLDELGAEHVPVQYGGKYQPMLLDEYCKYFSEIPMPKK